MGIIIGLIIFGIPSAIVAASKGFRPLRWLIALGLIGLVVVSFMPSAKKDGISSEEAEKRAGKADTVGAWMAGITIALNILGLAVLVSHS